MVDHTSKLRGFVVQERKRVSLGLAWSSFFDDFVTFCRRSESDLVAGVIVQFFRLLVWQVSSGDKDFPFSPEFNALGVEISLTDCQLGLFHVLVSCMF